MDIFHFVFCGYISLHIRVSVTSRGSLGLAKRLWAHKILNACVPELFRIDAGFRSGTTNSNANGSNARMPGPVPLATTPAPCYLFVTWNILHSSIHNWMVISLILWLPTFLENLRHCFCLRFYAPQTKWYCYKPSILVNGIFEML